MAIEYDVIVIGSGACGAAIACDLARRDKRVLLLEKGSSAPPRETLLGIAAIAREFSVGDRMNATTAYAVGGATNIYFGICKPPTAQTYAKLGIDLSAELAEVREELPAVELTDAHVPPQSRRVRDAAAALGYPMKAHPMLVDPAKCTGGRYSYEAKWKARSLVAQAVEHGATLSSGADVQRVVVEGGRAAGVAYRHARGLRGTLETAYAKKIVVSAGSPSTPKLLIASGIPNVGSRGFFCKPAFMVFGSVSGLAGRDAFVGMLEHDLGNGVSIGDGAMPSALFKLFMLSNGRLGRLFAHGTTAAVAVALSDELGGRITADGRYEKRLSTPQRAKLEEAAAIAARILEQAGAKHLFRSKLVAGTPGGVLWIGEHLDENLETGIRDLYVCDQSVIPDETITPLITLMCLSKRLARHLIASLDGASPAQPAAARPRRVPAAARV